MTFDLIAFITARLDDDERIARIAAAEFTRDSGLRWVVDDETHPECVRPAEPLDNSTVAIGAWGMIGKQGIHIARHDPARVLREVEAKRRLVTLHVGEDGSHGFWYCKTCGSGEPNEYPTEWPCATLKLLAAPYAEHPDYRAEWQATS